MLKSVTVINHLGERLKLNLGFPGDSGFYIKSITGLGPPQANIAITDIATADGGYYNSARTSKKNIVFNLGFYDESELVEDIRLRSYRFFPIKKQLTLIVETDRRIAYISGYVESNEPNIFSKSEDTQISIVCPYPYFIAHTTGDQTIDFSSISFDFEFEWSNELDDEETYDPVEGNLYTEFSSILPYTQYNIPYYGEIETGFVMTVHIYGSVTDITILNADTSESMKLNVSSLGLSAGDDIIISTVRGEKYVKLLSNGVYTNILNYLDRNSDWLVLRHGDNQLAYTATPSADRVGFSMAFNTLYEGM